VSTQKYVKVTITVEDDEEVTTMTIPMASDVHTENTQKHEWRDMPDGSRKAIPMSWMDLALNLTAFSYDETGVIMTTEHQEKNQVRTLDDVFAEREKLDAEYITKSEKLTTEVERLMGEQA
jgi:hypothetical protein